MTTTAPRRRSSLVFAFVLIAIGVLFLIANLRPDFDPWPFLSHWWPVLLIVLGVAKLIDRARSDQGSSGGGWVSGGLIVFVAFIVLIGMAVSRGHADSTVHHETKSVESQSSTSVVAHLEMPSGELELSGGSQRLLDADFTYTENEGTPNVSFHPSSSSGDLEITQHGGGVHIGRDENRWDLKLSNNLPMELNLNMGAGEGDLHLNDLQITRLEIHMGAGELNLDLSGSGRKNNLTGEIHGGAGEATIRLPRDIGVQVRASGGLGSISADGLHENGDEYTNDAWGKSPVSIRLNVEGGVGSINLIQQ